MRSTAEPTQPLSGWGRHPVAESKLRRPEKIASLRDAVATANGKPVIARGGGRSYGDAALNGEGFTVLTQRLDRMIAFDEEAGVLRCEAGVTIDDLLRTFVPRGWCLPVTPGTKYATVGGAVAFDVHGKNHTYAGAFSAHVQGLHLLTASGNVKRCSRTDAADLFWATVGGAGLTGVITAVELVLQPIETAFVRQRTLRTHSLAEALARLEEYASETTPHAVAWLDATPGRRQRGLVTLGRHATRADLAGTPHAEAPLRFEPSVRASVPFSMPGRLLNRATVRAFNAFRFHAASRVESQALISFNAFFYPLDAIRHWNRLYGARGFAQYQCVLPPETSRAGFAELFAALHEHGLVCPLAVLKKMGPASEAPLSFPKLGYTLALDLPIRDGTAALIRAFDEITLRHGGRVYLAKDAFLQPASFREMYERYPEWLRVKEAMDPENVFASSLSKRLHIQTRPHA